VSYRTERDFVDIEEAVEEVRAGRILVVVDDEDRENEGDLLMAADRVTPEAVNFMAKHGRGLICMPMMGERLDQLQISMMVSDNTAPLGTAFTVSVDARRGVTTGTSAFETEFAQIGPRDAKGRSLREFDLQRRLFKYPFSFLVYSESFDTLPQAVKAYLGRRIGEVLAGNDTSADFSHLSAADRQAIREILDATRPALVRF